MSEQDPVNPPLPSLAALLPAVYGDGLAPGVRQVGRALESVLGLLPLLAMPAEWARARAGLWLEHHLRTCARRLAQTEMARVVEVPPEVGVPIVERLATTSSPELAALYIELLAKAATRGSDCSVHPAYAQVLSAMAPDEARLLAVFARDIRQRGQVQPVYAALRLHGRATEGAALPLLAPIVDLDSQFDHDADSLFMLHVENLQRLGIVALSFDKTACPSADYERLRRRLSLSGQAPAVLQVQPGALQVTLFGSLLVSACVPDNAASSDLSSTNTPH